MQRLIKSFSSAVFLISALLCISCRTIRQPSSVPEPLNYSDDDIVQNEIGRIDAFMESEPVRALWRAKLLGREEVIDRCFSNLEELFNKALEEEKYLDAKKYYISLKALKPDWKSEKLSFGEVETLAWNNVPGFCKNTTPPSKISECMKAAVTIWVDRGVTVKHGAGYADVIIGSGFFIDSRGYIVTNHHVIDSMVNPKYEGYVRLYIKLPDDNITKIPAKVVGYDELMDLALLKAEITPQYVLNLGSSSDLEIGDKISAIGTPVGLEGTLTSGIISSFDRKLLALGNVFQIDAAVNSGNSGGPLIDQNLKVQAIVYAGMLQLQGLNFAIPVEYLKQELIYLYGRGEIVHSWIGCFGNTKRENSKKLGLEVQYVLPGGSGFMAGLSEGDVITSLDGKKVSSIDDFNFLMMGYETETILECRYISKDDGTEKSCLVYLDKRPENPALTVFDSDLITTSFVPLFGMKLIPSSTTNKNSYTIEKIIPGSSADDLSFSENDTVTVLDVVVDQKSKAIITSVSTKRKKKAFLDVVINLGTSFESPYYF
ncbi:serine protease, S1-C subfamily, contains C-terminal PDZ domain [Treponema bryantii]|uniref:Serine protease, S1-C subfamily, contains C-terminal PDZ domain n=1 Tax=Treponema bryantii TaxID=163 RepID=A0A1I3JL26_9SPIR|nr:S1C family serine protease [Treponema bryantii]SFI60830.1 serine protease, S1-C subfamily, contains C-terminal PDZ domain [Treponema bryantii]